MLDLWNFLKRHRAKIAAGTVLAGGAYIVQQMLQHSEHDSEAAYQYDRHRMQVCFNCGDGL